MTITSDALRRYLTSQPDCQSITLALCFVTDLPKQAELDDMMDAIITTASRYTDTFEDELVAEAMAELYDAIEEGGY